MPLPNTVVIGPTWQSHHESVALGQMTATITIYAPDQYGTRAPGADRTSFAEPTAVYTGPGRVQAHDIGGRVEVRNAADALTTKGAYQITIPKIEAELKVNYVIEVDADPDNPQLVGLSFLLVDFGRSSLSWQLDMGADLIEPTSRGGQT
jgi:hypothetical protein